MDECSSSSHNCSENATCTNTAGYFNCSCKPGYTGDGRVCSGIISEIFIKAIDFHLQLSIIFNGDHKYSPNTTCFKTARHFNCSCKAEHIGDEYLCFTITFPRLCNGSSFLSLLKHYRRGVGNIL